MPVPHSPPWLRFQSPLIGRVESWRGSHRVGESQLAGGFRHLPVPQSVPQPRLQLPPRRTQHADFPHYALLPASCQGFMLTYQTGSAFNRSCFIQPPPTPPLPAEPYASAFALAYSPRLRSCRLMGAFVISPLPPLLSEELQAAGSLRSTGVTPLPRCRVGGGAPRGWPPSAAQTARTVFP